jgi:hypothetical protein
VCVCVCVCLNWIPSTSRRKSQERLSHSRGRVYTRGIMSFKGALIILMPLFFHDMVLFDLGFSAPNGSLCKKFMKCSSYHGDYRSCIGLITLAVYIVASYTIPKAVQY